MDAVELLLPDGTPSRVWMCPECRRLVNRTYQPIADGKGHAYTDAERDEFARRAASRCCQEARCACGAGLGRKTRDGGYTKCVACRNKDEAAREQARFEKAKKLSPAEWDGMVVTPGGTFFDSLDALEEHFADVEPDDFVRPEYVWCTKPVGWEPDLSRHVLSGVHDNCHEDAGDQISAAALKELDDFGSVWWGKYGVESYDVDYSRCVVFAPATLHQLRRRRLEVRERWGAFARRLAA